MSDHVQRRDPAGHTRARPRKPPSPDCVVRHAHGGRVAPAVTRIRFPDGLPSARTHDSRGYTEEATLPDLGDVAAMEAFRQQTASATRSYLDRASDAELNTTRHMISDPGQTRLLRPADVILRIVTHIFNHQGQVLAMCRTIGKPNARHDLDYPVD
ncbi:MAG: hypothetical protein DMF86_25120 [Acidobacteria bacterium]|nr:MAG: hypothetical protein DMF86_25120 [Acidobacteriota bacterium]